ncbi:hypothetical protein GOV07_04040 [Candidatus Woesearchaeota archaeon]|nr:hypothetical protein [Candidatus Woesearchaeota archaeon]
MKIYLFPDEKALIDHVGENWNAAQDGSLFERRDRKELLLTPPDFAALFTPERLKLLLILKRERTTSISALAKRVGRRFEAVHRDLKRLAGYDLVTFAKKGRVVIPSVNGEIQMPVIA